VVTVYDDPTAMQSVDETQLTEWKREWSLNVGPTLVHAVPFHSSMTPVSWLAESCHPTAMQNDGVTQDDRIRVVEIVPGLGMFGASDHGPTAGTTRADAVAPAGEAPVDPTVNPPISSTGTANNRRALNPRIS
jgi:hypothetical protein